MWASLYRVQTGVEAVDRDTETPLGRKKPQWNRHVIQLKKIKINVFSSAITEDQNAFLTS